MDTEIKEFWNETMQEVDSLPLDCVEKKGAQANQYCDVDKLIFQGLGNKRFSCLRVVPKSEHGCSKRAVIFLPGGYAGWTPRPHVWFEGIDTLCVDPRGQGHSKHDCDVRDNITTGIKNRFTCHLRHVYADVRQSVNYLAASGYTSIAIVGNCFGGAIALGMGALDSRVKVVCAQMPYLADWERCANEKVKCYEYLLKYLDRYPNMRDKTFGVLRFFDLFNLVPDMMAHSFVTVGEGNSVVPPGHVWDIYSKIGGDKARLFLCDGNWGYGNDPNYYYWQLCMMRKYL